MTTMQDGDIARALSEELYWDTLLPSSIHVDVERGRASLTGDVSWNYQRDEAEEVVRRTPGVCGVDNLLRVRETVSPESVADAIGDAAISVSVNGSAVTLTGKVHSWHQRSEASRAAWSIRGVTAVHNRLAVG